MRKSIRLFLQSIPRLSRTEWLITFLCVLVLSQFLLVALLMMRGNSREGTQHKSDLKLSHREGARMARGNLASAIIGFGGLIESTSYSVDEDILISDISGRSGRFYNLDVPDFVVVMNEWSDVSEVPAGFLIPGRYVVIETNSPNACADITLEKCRARPSFVGEKSFSIAPSGGVALQAPATESAPATTQETKGIVEKALDTISSLLGIGAAPVEAPVSATSTNNQIIEVLPSDIASTTAATSTPLIEVLPSDIASTTAATSTPQ